MKLTHGSLFSGFGGFDFAAARCDIPTLWQCEKDRYCQKFLNHFFPSTPLQKDIYKFDYEKAEKVNIISGGFPCQDISICGKGGGITGYKSSAVFKQLEIIEVMHPDFAIFENSPALLTRGLDTILRHLTTIGYDAQWCCLSTSEFGYNHERKRLFLVSYPYVPGQTYRIFKPVGSINIHGYTPTETYIQVANKSDFTEGNYYDLCGVSRLPRNFRKLIAGFGNSVNVTVAEYVFRCILQFLKDR